MAMDNLKIVFHAYLPDIQTAISLPGLPDSAARIKLDIPSTDIGAIVLLGHHGKGHSLKVTIEVEDVPEDTDA